MRTCAHYGSLGLNVWWLVVKEIQILDEAWSASNRILKI